MKSIIVVCVLSFVALSSADTVLYPRGCIYIMGRCHEECPVGTHAYALDCDYKTPEATCRKPNPVAEKYKQCDYSACYCDPPTIRDEKLDKCVMPADCSPKETVPNVLVDPAKPPPQLPQEPKAEPSEPSKNPKDEKSKE